MAILFAEKWSDKVIVVIKVCDRVLILRLVLQRRTIAIISVCVPLPGVLDELKK